MFTYKLHLKDYFINYISLLEILRFSFQPPACRDQVGGLPFHNPESTILMGPPISNWSAQCPQPIPLRLGVFLEHLSNILYSTYVNSGFGRIGSHTITSKLAQSLLRIGLISFMYQARGL